LSATEHDLVAVCHYSMNDATTCLYIVGFEFVRQQHNGRWPSEQFWYSHGRLPVQTHQ